LACRRHGRDRNRDRSLNMSNTKAEHRSTLYKRGVAQARLLTSIWGRRRCRRVLPPCAAARPSREITCATHASSAHKHATPRLVQYFSECCAEMGSNKLMTLLDEWPVVASTPFRSEVLYKAEV